MQFTATLEEELLRFAKYGYEVYLCYNPVDGLWWFNAWNMKRKDGSLAAIPLIRSLKTLNFSGATPLKAIEAYIENDINMSGIGI